MTEKRVLKRDALAAHEAWTEAAQVWGATSSTAQEKLAEYNQLRGAWEAANGHGLFDVADPA